MIVSSTVKTIVPIIIKICMFDSVEYNEAQKERCYIHIINCSIASDGKLKTDNILKSCFEQGRTILNEKSLD